MQKITTVNLLPATRQDPHPERIACGGVARGGISPGPLARTPATTRNPMPPTSGTVSAVPAAPRPEARCLKGGALAPAARRRRKAPYCCKTPLTQHAQQLAGGLPLPPDQSPDQYAGIDYRSYPLASVTIFLYNKHIQPPVPRSAASAWTVSKDQWRCHVPTTQEKTLDNLFDRCCGPRGDQHLLPGPRRRCWLLPLHKRSNRRQPTLIHRRDGPQ